MTAISTQREQMAWRIDTEGLRQPASPATESADGGTASWLLCRAGLRLCAVPIEHVVEIMRVQPIEAIGGAPLFVRGLSIIRGAPTLVVDAGLLFSTQRSRIERLAMIRTGSRTIALGVESVLGVRSIGAGASDELPPLLRDAATDMVTAIGMVDAELLLFLSAARLVPESLLDSLVAAAAAP